MELKTSGDEPEGDQTMSEEKKREPRKTLYDWDFMEMQNPRPGVREKTLEFFRNNPISVTIRPARELHPDMKPSLKNEDEETAPE
jgi:hypothetical protein